ncbi:MAG: TonB-dependent receptor [Spirosomaceae bacterium]|nr:TonB-dependent receptor [Spirosomataceae bacterium]
MKQNYSIPIKGIIVCALLLLSVVTSFAQKTVSGKVSDSKGEGIPGASVSVKGTKVGAITDASGGYQIQAPNTGGTLVFSSIGYRSQESAIGNNSTINITLEEDLSALEEVVVTGYTSEKKKDIIGSVSVVNTKTMVAQPNANLSSMLQGRAAGITVSGTGAPGAASKVRIRGFVSFGNNDPLYVIDGVPTDNANALNPQDVESVQVLKDPVSASIYGSRAANGVIVVTTRQGGTNNKTNISYDGYYGIQQNPERSYPKMLNTQQYADFLWRSFQGAGIQPNSAIFGRGASPVIPSQLWTSMNVNTQSGPVPGNYRVFPDLPPSSYGPYQIYQTSQGTDWFREITQTAPVQNHQITATGGSDKGNYSMGLNYFGQEGVFKFTDLERVTLRANTRYKPTKWLTVGENLQFAYTKQLGSNGNPFDLGGGLDFSGEGGPWAQAYRMVPYIPVFDINGNFGGNGVGESGNGTNPYAALVRGKDNRYDGFNIFGNIFAQVNFLKDFTFSTSYGIDQRIGNGSNFTFITYERAENQQNNAFGEYFFRGGSWTWTNTLQWNKVFAEKHSVKAFAGTEANFEQFRSISASRIDYDFSDPAFRSLNTGKNLPQNSGAPSTPRALSSIFGKAEYMYNDKYMVSFTLRQDKSSVFGPENRVGTFPAVGAAWRISEESFIKAIPAISDLKLRAGWGQMGSQRNVGATNAFSFFGAGINSTAYDINGGNSGVVIGYRPSVAGNPGTRWEAAEMINVGLDGSLWNGKLDFNIEYFNNTTKDLLVGRQRNGLEMNVGQPAINVGTMLNAGIDGSVSTRGKIKGGLEYDVALTFTSFRNEAKKLDAEGSAFFEQGAGRLGGVQRTEAGRPLSSFFGYQIEGIFQTQGEVDAHPKFGTYNRVGTWKIKDVDGNGVINADDRTYLGVPIPKFQLGSDIVLKYKNFDFNTFLYWNYGNQIYNYTKWWTDLRGFVGGVSERALTDSWSPSNPNGTLPILNTNDAVSGSISTSYYVEPGSFLRARQVQLGYTLPAATASKLGLSRARVYVQGQNVFTITKYSGPDPDIGILGNELQMGVDQFRTPAPSVFIVGLNFGF